MGFSLNVIISASILFLPVYGVTTEQDAEFGRPCVPLIQANERNIATFVRLIFHDCISGCDGCLDTELRESVHNDSVNAGLENAHRELTEAYNNNQLDRIASKADFFAKCAQVSIEAARLRGEFSTTPDDVPIRMRYGREDCNGNPRERAEDFPNPRLGLNHVLEWCSRVLKFNARECVAIMGAHTLGEANKDNSGYDNAWVKNEYGLDNFYYRDMIERDWEQKNVGGQVGTSAARWQFEANGLMMLNVDMCLLKNIKPDRFGRVTDELDVTGSAITVSYVRAYSRDNKAWLADFSQVFNRLMGNGYTDDQLTEVIGGQAPAPEGIEHDPTRPDSSEEEEEEEPQEPQEEEPQEEEPQEEENPARPSRQNIVASVLSAITSRTQDRIQLLTGNHAQAPYYDPSSRRERYQGPFDG